MSDQKFVLSEDTARCLFGPDRFGTEDELSDIAETVRRDCINAGFRIWQIDRFVRRVINDGEPLHKPGLVSREVYLDQLRRSAYAEIRYKLRLAARPGNAYIDLAVRLCRRFPSTVEAMCNGLVSEQKAKVLDWELSERDDTFAARIEEAVLDQAPGLTPSNFRRAVRAKIEELDPDGAAERHEEAVRARRVQCWETKDGMSQIRATLPTEAAELVMDRLSFLARQTDLAEQDGRGIDAIRADLFVDLLLELHATGVTYKVEVITEDPDLDAQVNKHDPNAKQVRFIRRRDQHCREPGCRRVTCDLDHAPLFSEHGITLTSTVHLRCKDGHVIRHLPGWSVEQLADGTIILTTGTGRRYQTRPPRRGGVDHPTEELPPAA